MKKRLLVTFLLLPVVASVFWLIAPLGPKPSELILRNSGTNSVFIRTSPPLKLPRLAFTLSSWPPVAKPVPLNAVILNSGCVVTQKFAYGARIEVCTRIPSANVFQGVVHPGGIILTDGYSPLTSNMQFQTVWQRNVRRIQADLNPDGPTNNLLRVIKID